MRRGGGGGGPGPVGGPGGGAGQHRYQMREKLVSIGDDFWIENGMGQRVYKVDGKALRVRDTLKIRDARGNEVAEIKEKLVTVRDTMDISRGGKTIATVKKALVTPLRGRFSVKLANGGEMDVQGNLLDHEYRIDQGGRQVAEASKKWFRVRDTYGVDIQPGQDDALILAITVVVDQMSSVG